jgi:hypothetical protein
MMKPAAKVPKAARSEAVGLWAGKKCVPICRAKKPKSAKSYHSSTLPATPAMTPRRTARGVWNSWVITPGGMIGGTVVMVSSWRGMPDVKARGGSAPESRRSAKPE